MRPCQQCGTALENHDAACPDCGHEQAATMGLDAPRLPRRREKPTEPLVDRRWRTQPLRVRIGEELRHLAINFAVVLALPVLFGMAVWSTFGVQPALIAFFVLLLVVGAIAGQFVG